MAGRKLNILITGPYSAGKSQFIETISEIPIVSTERRVTNLFEFEDKSFTTVAMDYGRVTLGDDVLHLRGTPGQERFDFMRELLAREVDGFVLLIDSTNQRHVPKALEILRGLNNLDDRPRVVAANKQDLPNATHVSALEEELGLPEGTLILPCISTRRSSVRQVLIQLLDRIALRAEGELQAPPE